MKSNWIVISVFSVRTRCLLPTPSDKSDIERRTKAILLPRIGSPLKRECYELPIRRAIQQPRRSTSVAYRRSGAKGHEIRRNWQNKWKETEEWAATFDPRRI